MRSERRLSALTISRLSTAGADCFEPDGGGLYFRIEGRSQSWTYRFGLAGRTRYMGLGPHPEVSLSEARELRDEARKLVKRGIDPIDLRQTERQSEHEAKIKQEVAKIASGMTFDKCAREYITTHEPGWRNEKHRQQWVNTLNTYVSPVFGSLPVSVVDVPHVLQVLQPIWTSKPETASRVRGRIEAILDWATVHRFRTGENPARWRGHLKHLLASARHRVIKHHAALHYEQLPALFEQLQSRQSMSATALSFLILTAARTSEVIGATWSEIDFEKRTWTVPAARMKAGQTHRVPLSPPALAVLEQLNEGQVSEFAFSGRDGRPLSNMAMAMLLRGRNRQETVHGFRSTFRDWVSEQTFTQREVAEAALAHTIPDAVEAAYRRGDLFEKRRQLMNAWGSYCTGGTPEEKVNPISAEKARG